MIVSSFGRYLSQTAHDHESARPRRGPYDAGVTIRLASDGPQTVRADTIGAAWLAVAQRILTEGVESRYDDLPVREISLATLVVDRPGPTDEIIARHAEPERLAVKSAHVYETERGYLRDVLEEYR